MFFVSVAVPKLGAIASAKNESASFSRSGAWEIAGEGTIP
jgi:hypothetical protein